MVLTQHNSLDLSPQKLAMASSLLARFGFFASRQLLREAYSLKALATTSNRILPLTTQVKLFSSEEASKYTNEYYEGVSNNFFLLYSFSPLYIQNSTFTLWYTQKYTITLFVSHPTCSLLRINHWFCS